MSVMWSVQSKRRLSILAAAAVLGFRAAPAAAGVFPVGDHFSAALSPGTKASFKLGASTTITCSVSTFSGTVTASQPMPITTPIFNNGGTAPCSGSISGITVSAPVTTSSANGTWSLSINGTGPTAVVTLTIPRGGISISESLLGNTCTVLAAPAAAAAIVGTWQNGAGGGKPTLIFSNVSLPAQTSGGGLCPSGTSLTFSASYEITDTTSPPPTQITVAAP